MSHRNNDSRIYVGNLPPDVRDKDIDDLFYKFGKISYIDLKNRRGPPFAFIEFDDPRFVSYIVCDWMTIYLFTIHGLSTGMPKMLFMLETVMTTMDTGFEWNFPEEEKEDLEVHS